MPFPFLTLCGIGALIAFVSILQKTKNNYENKSANIIGSDLESERVEPKPLELRYFEIDEFGGWYPKIDPLLLTMLDSFRDRWGYKVLVSPALGAVGRDLPEGHSNYESQHNVRRWGAVRAIDVMPLRWSLERNPVDPGRVLDRGLSKQELEHAYNVARAVGFSGIGVYPDWEPFPGLHLDVRRDRSSESPAIWSGILINGKQEYVEIERAFA